MEAPKHPLQDARLRALHGYEILDTDREKDFDDIVQLAAALCGTAIAVVNLIDAERQWFKAEVGLGVRETPLATSICSHVILEEDFVEIRDTLQDPRMIDNPLCCSDPGLRFYAGALLTTEDGLPIGTLCVLDYKPRALTPLQRDAIRVLARQVMAQIEMRSALRRAKVLRQEVDHRVKNSLQSLMSFLRVQERAVAGQDAKAALVSARARVEAAAVLHEHLYRTDAGPVIDLRAYLDHLKPHFVALAPPGVSVVVNAQHVLVGSQQAVAVGTLVNEFVANSFKHAFPSARAGAVTITVSTDGAGNVTVVCADDGVGMPPQIEAAAGGLGMKIAHVVSAELRCELIIDSSEGGHRVEFTFESSLPAREWAQDRAPLDA